MSTLVPCQTRARLTNVEEKLVKRAGICHFQKFVQFTRTQFVAFFEFPKVLTKDVTNPSFSQKKTKPKIGANFPNVPKPTYIPLFQVSEMLTTGNAEGGGAVRSGRPHDNKARGLNDLKFEDFQDTLTTITQVRGGRQKYRRYPMEGHLSGSIMPVRKVNSPLLS